MKNCKNCHTNWNIVAGKLDCGAHFIKCQRCKQVVIRTSAETAEDYWDEKQGKERKVDNERD